MKQQESLSPSTSASPDLSLPEEQVIVTKGKLLENKGVPVKSPKILKALQQWLGTLLCVLSKLFCTAMRFGSVDTSLTYK